MHDFAQLGITMKIDILSDIHIDSWHDPHTLLSHARFNEIFSPILLKNKGDVLIISGDLGHYNTQNLDILKRLKQEYQAIIYVWGNHDFYCVSNQQKKRYKSGFEKANELREMINKEDGLYHLDGEIVEIGGIRFGGLMGWYGSAYLSNDREANQARWHQLSNDSKIKGFEDVYFDDMHKADLLKLEQMYKKVDVMITHTCPFLAHDGEPFYHFDGEKYLKDGSMEVWVYGHTHKSVSDTSYNVNLVTNALGRKSEKRKIKPFQVEV